MNNDNDTTLESRRQRRSNAYSAIIDTVKAELELIEKKPRIKKEILHSLLCLSLKNFALKPVGFLGLADGCLEDWEENEYHTIGKPNRKRWSELVGKYLSRETAYFIQLEYGCFDY